MDFTAPYNFTWGATDGPCGGFITSPELAPDPRHGEFSFNLQNEPSASAHCSIITSFGIDAGPPRTVAGNPISGFGVLSVSALVEVDGFVLLNATFANAAN